MAVAPLTYYFPRQIQGTDTRLEVLDLMGNDQALPYTEDQARIFRVAKRALTVNEYGLGKTGYATIVIVPVTLSLFALKIIDEGEVASIATGLTVLIASNIMSMIFTGTLPSKASDEANNDQNVLEELQGRFDDLGCFLLLQYQNSDQRETILEKVSRIDFSLIEEKLQRASTQKGKVKNTLKFLNDVAEYIKTGNTNFNSKLELELWKISETRRIESAFSNVSNV